MLFYASKISIFAQAKRGSFRMKENKWNCFIILQNINVNKTCSGFYHLFANRNCYVVSI